MYDTASPMSPKTAIVVRRHGGDWSRCPPRYGLDSIPAADRDETGQASQQLIKPGSVHWSYRGKEDEDHG